jgi:hypothetical protein
MKVFAKSFEIIFLPQNELRVTMANDFQTLRTFGKQFLGF